MKLNSLSKNGFRQATPCTEKLKAEVPPQTLLCTLKFAPCFVLHVCEVGTSSAQLCGGFWTGNPPGSHERCHVQLQGKRDIRSDLPPQFGWVFKPLQAKARGFFFRERVKFISFINVLSLETITWKHISSHYAGTTPAALGNVHLNNNISSRKIHHHLWAQC